MAIHLIVTFPFASYQAGQTITDQDTIAEILSGPNHGKVVKLARPEPEAAAVEVRAEEPAPAPEKARDGHVKRRPAE